MDSSSDTSGGQNPPTHNQNTELANIDKNRIECNKQLHMSLKRIQNVNQPGNKELAESNSDRRQKKTIFALQKEYRDSFKELESELGQFMTEIYEQSTEEMMWNEKAQQISACLATLQHAHDRLNSNSDT